MSWIMPLFAISAAYFAHTAKGIKSQWWSLARINLFMMVSGMSIDARDLRYLMFLFGTALCSALALGMIQYFRGK